MNTQQGKAFLVGAGPGDPELITVKGLRLLSQADVVIHDRLIGQELLSFCRSDALLIDVGKYPDHHRVSQTEINQLIVKHAFDGRDVVRLKGGDPFVFGRGMEELKACRSAGVDCQIIPGISSAIAAPTAAGIPITTRGIARSFVVVTGQTDPNLPEHDLDFSALSKIDTVIFLMGHRNLNSLTQKLINSGRPRDEPVTCIERATMPGEQIASGTLATIAQIVKEQELSSPMVTVVGKVAGLARHLALESNTHLESLSE